MYHMHGIDGMYGDLNLYRIVQGILPGSVLHWYEQHPQPWCTHTLESPDSKAAMNGPAQTFTLSLVGYNHSHLFVTVQC